MREIATQIEIDAPPADVWRVLMGFAEFEHWNPFIRSLEGKPFEGERLRALLEPPGGKAMTFRPTVVRVSESREFRWLGHFLFPGLFDGEHIFELEDLEGRTRFVQREQFRGILAGPMLRMIGDKTRGGFVAMNEALRDRVERSDGSAQSISRPVG